ncbi:acetyltransferase [Janthinobacterium sp. HLX7-2]|uniref:acetyltransferase n=1 Tax=Janthinobacterium sp. HLX7-2 TaxID=1259331 RepID=UPI003F266875
MKPVILFGTGKIAEVILYFLRHHSQRQVVACCVDREYVPGPHWQDLPVVAFEEISSRYPAETHDMFIALGYQGMNALRAEKCAQARQLGYTLASYVHPDAGLPLDCRYGDNCFIMNQVHVHPCVTLGDNVFVWSGALIGHHSSIANNCWLTSATNISGNVKVGENCFFGINSTIGNSVQIGASCFIGANTLVTKCTQDEQVFLQESSKAFRLNSRQFLRMSRFDDL